MSIAVCPTCRSMLRVAADAAGKAARCPRGCGVFRITKITPDGFSARAGAAQAEEPVLGENDVEVVNHATVGGDVGDEPEELDEPRGGTRDGSVFPGGDPFAGQDAPEEVQDHIRDELEKGERVLWIGRPNKTLMMIRGLGGTAAGFLMFLALAVYLVGVAAGVFQGGKDWRGWPLCFLIEAPFYVASVGVMLVPVWWGWQATRTWYVLTNRRAVVWSRNWYGALSVHSSSPDDLADMRRVESWVYGRGTGDLIFRGARFYPQTDANGFLAVDDVRRVERLVRDALTDR